MAGEAGAVEIVACLLGSGTDMVAWALPDNLAAAARKAVAANMFVAADPNGAMERLRLVDPASARFDHADEIWLLDGADRRSALRNVSRTCDLNIVHRPADAMPVDADALGGWAADRMRLFAAGWPVDEEAALGAPNPVGRFLDELHDFKCEMEERISAYFDFHALRCLRPRGDGPLLVDAGETARAMVETARDPGTRGGHWAALDAAESTFEEFCEQAGEAFGIGLLAVDRAEALNPVDRLFHQRIGERAQAIVCAAPPESFRPLDPPIRYSPAARAEAIARLRRRCDSRRAERNRRCSSVFAALKPKPVEAQPGLAYLAAGDGGTPVVLINALGQGLAYWSRLFDALSLHRRVIVWEPRVEASSDLTLADQVTDLERILDCEGVARCLAVAWCTGPKVALELCRRRPAAVEAMVFLNPSFKGPGVSGELDSVYERTLQQLCALVDRRPDMAPMVRNALRDSVAAGIAADESAWAAAAPAAMNADLREHVLDPFRTDSITVAYCRQLLDFWSHDPTRPQTPVPLLVIAAEFDQVASPSMARVACDLFADAQYAEIPGATHYCLYDRPEFVAALIEDFFRGGKAHDGATRGAGSGERASAAVDFR